MGFTLKIFDMDREDFIKTFDPYYNKVYNYAYHITLDDYTAEDLTQYAFLLAFNNPEYFLQFDSIQSALKTVVRNKFINVANKNVRRKDINEQLRYSAISEAAEKTINEILEEKELRDALMDSVRNLPEPYRQIITLFYAEGLSMAEIASTLDLKYSTALYKRNKALKLLHRSLEQRGIHNSTNDIILLLMTLGGYFE